MELDFTFEQNPWEAELQKLSQGESLSATSLLSMMEQEPDEAMEDAFGILEEKGITLDIQTLPAVTASGDTALRLHQEQQLVKEDNLLTGLGETDPLRLYLEELAQTPVSGDEALLALEYTQGSETAAEKLTALKLSRVVELAKQYTGKGVLLLDLIQEGSLGLWQSVLNYTGGDFTEHSDWWIRQYLARAVTLQARSAGIGQKLRQGLEDYRDVDQRLLSELGRNPTQEEIAEAMHATVEDVAVYEAMLTSARSKQRVEEARQEREPQPEDQQAVEDTAYFQSRQRIMEMLSTLTEQEAKVLSLRFGLEGGLPLSPEDTGKKLGLTAQQIVAAEAAALAKLRKEN